MAFGLMLLTVTACATASPSGDFCAVYVPVYSRASDRPELRDAINANNAVWLERCSKPAFKIGANLADLARGDGVPLPNRLF